MAPKHLGGASIKGKQAAVHEGQFLQFLRSVGYKDELPPSTVAWLESAPVFRFLAAKLSHDNFVSSEDQQEYNELMLARGPDVSLYDAVEGFSSDAEDDSCAASTIGPTEKDPFLADLTDEEVSRLLEVGAQTSCQAWCSADANAPMAAVPNASCFYADALPGQHSQNAADVEVTLQSAKLLEERLDCQQEPHGLGTVSSSAFTDLDHCCRKRKHMHSSWSSRFAACVQQPAHWRPGPASRQRHRDPSTLASKHKQVINGHISLVLLGRDTSTNALSAQRMAMSTQILPRKPSSYSLCCPAPLVLIAGRVHFGANQVRLLACWVVDIKHCMHDAYCVRKPSRKSFGLFTLCPWRPPVVLTVCPAANQLSSVKLDAQQLSDELDSILQELEAVCSELCSLAQQPQAWLLCAADQSGYRAMDDHINAQHARCVAAQQHAPFSAT